MHGGPKQTAVLTCVYGAGEGNAACGGGGGCALLHRPLGQSEIRTRPIVFSHWLERRQDRTIWLAARGDRQQPKIRSIKMFLFLFIVNKQKVRRRKRKRARRRRRMEEASPSSMKVMKQLVPLFSS